MDTENIFVTGGIALGIWWLWSRSVSPIESLAGSPTSSVVPVAQARADVATAAVFPNQQAARVTVRQIIDSLESATSAQYTLALRGMIETSIIDASTYPAEPPYAPGTYKILPTGGVRVALAQARSAAGG